MKGKVIYIILLKIRIFSTNVHCDQIFGLVIPPASSVFSQIWILPEVLKKWSPQRHLSLWGGTNLWLKSLDTDWCTPPEMVRPRRSRFQSQKLHMSCPVWFLEWTTPLIWLQRGDKGGADPSPCLHPQVGYSTESSKLIPIKFHTQ